MTHEWSNIEQLQSSDENVKKYIFKKDDAIAEAVLYKYPTYEDRTVMCISTQTGCPMGCSFCGTGKFFGRNLTSDEIINQVETMVDDNDLKLNESKRVQIMVMSMGEPVFNSKELEKAFTYFYKKYPEAALLISTSAPSSERNWERIFEITQKFSTVGLQFSIHESTDEKRNKLIPFPSKLNLQQISEMGQKWYSIAGGRRPFFNFCVHNENNTDEDVQRLTNLFDPSIWECTLSVICEKDQTIAESVQHNLNMINNFSSRMLNNGFNVRVFDPAGQDDIGGGCGQLWQVQKFAEENPTVLKESPDTKFASIEQSLNRADRDNCKVIDLELVS